MDPGYNFWEVLQYGLLPVGCQPEEIFFFFIMLFIKQNFIFIYLLLLLLF